MRRTRAAAVPEAQGAILAKNSTNYPHSDENKTFHKKNQKCYAVT
jgi:hypothetical protein